MPSSFVTLVTYREHTYTEEEIIAIDNEDVVIGLESLGIKPLVAKTDGRKLLVTFPKADVDKPFQQIQAAMLGATPTPLMVDYNLILLARMSWKGLLTMMRTVPIQK